MKNKVTDQPGGWRRRRPSRRGNRRRLLVALAASALVHLLLIVLYPFFSGRYPARSLVPYQEPPRETGATQVIRIVEVSTPEAGDPDDPVELEPSERPEIDVEPPDFGEDLRIGRTPRYLTAVERLRLGPTDRRLWRPVDPALAAPTPEQILNLEIAAAIETGNDSAAAAAERARRALDWTHTDEDGRRWGVSPGKIHLGDLTIPLPFGFGPPPDYNGDRAEWAFRMADIQRAASTLAVLRSWEDRREAMKKRRDELRALRERERAKEKDVVPPVVRPDTIPGQPEPR